jgi:hypothetical protein
MNAEDILDEVPEHPELLLALSLSAPNRSASTLRQDFAVEISEEHITVRTPVPGRSRVRSALLVCTKETISLAILLQMLWEKKRGSRV